MANLVSVAEAQSHLRLDTDTADDAWMEIFIPAISEAVLGWLKDEWRAYVAERGSAGTPVLGPAGKPVPEVDGNGLMTPKWSVKAAVLVEIASQFRFRAGEGTDNVVKPDAGYGYVLNKASTDLLAPLRKS